MGARKRRQEEPCGHGQLQSTHSGGVDILLSPQSSAMCPGDCHVANRLINVKISQKSGVSSVKSRKSRHCLSCCNKLDDTEKSAEQRKSKELNHHFTEIPKSVVPNLVESSRCFLNLLLCLSSKTSKSLLSTSKADSVTNKYFHINYGCLAAIRLFILLILASSNLFVPPVEGVCVWQGGGGFRVACGFRQSGLFRIRSVGGIKGYVGAGFTIGDEDGFKDSLTNTETQQAGAYVIPNNVHSQRSLPTSQNGVIGQYTPIQDHAVPIPTGDPASQRQQQFQYLDTIQRQMETDNQGLHNTVADQYTQKMLEQQIHLQGGAVPKTPVTTGKAKRAGGLLTKRASMWNWPTIFGRGKNGGKNKPKQHNGPPPVNRRGGPPHKNKPPPGKTGPAPRGGRYPPNPKNRPTRPTETVGDSFMHPMKNPFSHLQDNFVGKANSYESQRMHNFNQGREHINQKYVNGRDQFPRPPPQEQASYQKPASFSGEASGQFPQQHMVPPASPELPAPAALPKFKKIPNNKKPLNNNPDYDDPPGNQPQYDQAPLADRPADRMMSDVDDPVNIHAQPPTDFFNSNGFGSLERQFNEYETDPAGLKMLKQTENFGTIYHLLNPDGSPVNMQFEKQPIYPPGVELTSQQQQDLVDELSSVLPQPNTAEIFGESDPMSSPLATAVYDPNVFPDIYFTTTEKHNSVNNNMFGGAGGLGTYSLSEEMMNNPLLSDNQIKRILGSSSVEKTGSEGGSSAAVKHVASRKKSGAVLGSTETSGDQQTTRRKMRRRKKLRMGNQVDTSEHDLTGADGSASPAGTGLLKRRRKGRRKKKYRLHTMRAHNQKQEGGNRDSTDRMGVPAEPTSAEMHTETAILNPLTTTPLPSINLVVVTPTSVNNTGDGNLMYGEKKIKTSFTLPSSEDILPTSLEQPHHLTGPSSENKIDTGPSITSTKKSSEETTTNLPISYSTFGYYDALRHQQKSDPDADYEEFSGPSGSGYFRAGYDPRYPPDHEVNRGHNMTKFIRPRIPGSPDLSPSSSADGETSGAPFILYDMTGTRNQSRFSSKFHKDKSPFTLDGHLSAKQEPNRVGDVLSSIPHPLFANNKLLNGNHGKSDNGVFLKLDSREWGSDRKSQSSHFQKDHVSDPFQNHYNSTSLTSGHIGSFPSKEFRPSAEIPWDKGYQIPPSTAQPPSRPNYASGSSEHNKFLKSSGSLEHGIFGPTMETFGLPKPSSTPMSSSGEKQRKLHKNLFGGSSADVSDLADWASPNFWGTLQDADRYSPSVDFNTNNENDLRRLVSTDSANGLKEMKPADLSTPTPLPVPVPSPPHNTMEDLLEDPEYFLSPSTPGERWGKQRKRKGRPTTTLIPTTVPSVPFVMSSFPTTQASHFTTSAAPVKWLAVMSNEVDSHPEYYDNLSMIPPGSSSIEMNLKKTSGKGKKKSGIEIKFKSGEERDPEEEEQNETNNTASATIPRFDIAEGYPAGTGGFPGLDFESSMGYDFGGGGKGKIPPPPPPPGFPHVHIPPSPSSEIQYFPTVSGDKHGEGENSASSNILKSHQGPVFPGRSSNNRRDFVPSAEDLGPLPSSVAGNSGSGGLPSHKDNPFKMFEKQHMPANSGMGFVSTKEEIQEIEDQISKFSTIPNTFMRRDSSEKMGGSRVHAPNLEDGSPTFHGPSASPAEENIPGFITIPLPGMGPDPHHQQSGHESSLYGPSSFHAGMSGPPSSYSSSSPHTGPGSSDIPSGPPGLKESHGPTWDYRPIEHNDVNELGPPHPDMREGDHILSGPPFGGNRPPVDSNEEFRKHHEIPPKFRDGLGNEMPIHLANGPTGPVTHLSERPSGPPPHSREGPSGPPHSREDPTGPPHLLRDGPPGAPPHLSDGHPGPSLHMHDGPSGPPPHLGKSQSGPPHHLRNGPPGPPPPYIREGQSGLPSQLHDGSHQRNSQSGSPPHLRDGPPGPPPHLRDGPPGPPSHLRDGPPGPPSHLREGPSGPPSHIHDGPSGPPPHLRNGQSRPPPHLRDGPSGPPPHMRDGPSGPPPHLRNSQSGPPPHLRDGHSGPPPHMRDSGPPHLLDGGSSDLPHHLRDGPSGPPPHLSDGPSGPPPRLRDGPPGPPHHPRDGPPHHMRDGPPRPPHNIRDGPPHNIRDGPPHNIRDGPPHNIRDGPPHNIRDGPPHNIRDGPPHNIRDGSPGPPPHIREGPPGQLPHRPNGPSHLKDGLTPGLLRPPPPPREDRDRPRSPHDRPPHDRPPHDRPPHDRPPHDRPPHDRPPHDRPPHDRPPHDRPPHDRPPHDRPPHDRPPHDRPPHDRPPHDRPPIREESPLLRPPPTRDDHPMRPPPFREDNPLRPPSPTRDDHHPRSPPQRDERPSHPPGKPNDFPPRGPPGHRDLEKRPPPPREFERDGPPRHASGDRARDPPHMGPDSHKHHMAKPHGPPAGFFGPPTNEHLRFDHDKRNFLDGPKPPNRDHFHDGPHDHRGDHSNFNSWQDDKMINHKHPNVPPTPHGMPDFLDIQKVPKDQKHFKDHPPKSMKNTYNPFAQKHHPPSKKPLPSSHPTKIPPQGFKPPSKSQNQGNFFSNILHGGPFNKHSSSKHPPPPPPNSRPHQLPSSMNSPNSHPLHSINPPPRKPSAAVSPQSEPDQFPKGPFHDPSHLPPTDLNYINPFNDRYKQSGQPPLHPDDPNHKLHLIPERMPPLPPNGPEPAGSRVPFLPFPPIPGASYESSMVDLDRNPNAPLLPPTFIKANHPEDPALPVRTLQQQHSPPKQAPHPVYQPKPTRPDAKIDQKYKVLEAFETLNKANYDVIQSIAADQYGQKFIDKIKTKNDAPHNKPIFPPHTGVSPGAPPPTKKQDENTKLADLLRMINSKSSSSHLQPVAAASTMVSPKPSGSVDPLSSLLQQLSKPTVTTPTTTTTTQRFIPELPSNPGLVSLTSLSQGSGHDIKSLQAQIAKAIIAKAHQKTQHVEQTTAPSNESPLAVLQQLAQNRQATIQQQTNSKNYTTSQLETLKKLIALNKLEDKLAPSSTTSTEDPLKKLQALLPAALQAAKQQHANQMLSSNTISRKMLDSTTANSLAHQQSNSLLQNPDPTILALKAIAMSKAQGINPQPSIALPQQVKPTEPSAQPIAVDLSAILSPSPPVVEVNRKRRLTNVRNAPKSFYPANATQGFEDFAGPFMTDFHCDEQSFFPGLYADTELGCRVFHLCAKTEAGYMMKSFRCPKETVFDQEVLRCNWNLFVECPASKNKYHFNKYLSQSFQFLKILGEFSANSQKPVATSTG